jgi:hypothetical protein
MTNRELKQILLKDTEAGTDAEEIHNVIYDACNLLNTACTKADINAGGVIEKLRALDGLFMTACHGTLGDGDDGGLTKEENRMKRAQNFSTASYRWFAQQVVDYGATAGWYLDGASPDVMFSAVRRYEDGAEHPHLWLWGCCVWPPAAPSPCIVNCAGWFPVLADSIRQRTRLRCVNGQRLYIDDTVNYDDGEYVVKYGRQLPMEKLGEDIQAQSYAFREALVPPEACGREEGYTLRELVNAAEFARKALTASRENRPKFTGRLYNGKVWYEQRDS